MSEQAAEGLICNQFGLRSTPALRSTARPFSEPELRGRIVHIVAGSFLSPLFRIQKLRENPRWVFEIVPGLSDLGNAPNPLLLAGSS